LARKGHGGPSFLVKKLKIKTDPPPTFIKIREVEIMSVFFTIFIILKKHCRNKILCKKGKAGENIVGNFYSFNGSGQ
jgi:hypothetical protein